MAYFSNGSEGDYATEHFCERCIHNPPNDSGDGCPVWLLHLLWNYDQIGETEVAETKAHALNILWPRDKVRNGDCRMYIERK